MGMDSMMWQRYLDGQSSPEEMNVIRSWLSTEEGQAFLSASLERDMNNIREEDVDNWIDHPIPSSSMKAAVLAPMRRTFRRKRWLTVAAVVLPFFLLVGIAWLLADRAGLLSAPEYAEFSVPHGEQMQVVLQDGTTVHLNSASRLRFPKKFSFFRREVELWGEAYFDVAKEKRQPFVVNLHDMNLRVTGTRFNVKAYPQEDKLQVMLVEGGVTLADGQQRTYVLSPGECADYDRSSGICKISRVDDEKSITGWRERSLNFYRTPLMEILKTLQRQYDVVFETVDSTLLSTQFTLSTTKVQALDILKDIERVSHIRFLPKGEEGVFVVSSE